MVLSRRVRAAGPARRESRRRRDRARSGGPRGLGARLDSAHRRGARADASSRGLPAGTPVTRWTTARCGCVTTRASSRMAVVGDRTWRVAIMTILAAAAARIPIQYFETEQGRTAMAHGACRWRTQHDVHLTARCDWSPIAPDREDFHADTLMSCRLRLRQRRRAVPWRGTLRGAIRATGVDGSARHTDGQGRVGSGGPTQTRPTTRHSSPTRLRPRMDSGWADSRSSPAGGSSST